MSQSISLLSKEQELALQIADLQQLLMREREKNKSYESQVSWLTEQLKTLKRNQFGTKSERWESQEQLKFNEAEVEARNPAPEKEDRIVEVMGAAYRPFLADLHEFGAQTRVCRTLRACPISAHTPAGV